VSREELCNNATIDAIVTVQDGTTYTFKGKEWVEKSCVISNYW
jgi:hypothetical protein